MFRFADVSVVSPVSLKAADTFPVAPMATAPATLRLINSRLSIIF
jgi:hypothetical protein